MGMCKKFMTSNSLLKIKKIPNFAMLHPSELYTYILGPWGRGLQKKWHKQTVYDMAYSIGFLQDALSLGRQVNWWMRHKTCVPHDTTICKVSHKERERERDRHLGR